jgi:hypothetical protein
MTDADDPIRPPTDRYAYLRTNPRCPHCHRVLKAPKPDPRVVRTTKGQLMRVEIDRGELRDGRSWALYSW